MGGVVKSSGSLFRAHHQFGMRNRRERGGNALPGTTNGQYESMKTCMIIRNVSYAFPFFLFFYYLCLSD